MKKSHRAESTVAEVQGGDTSEDVSYGLAKGGTQEPYAPNIGVRSKVSSKPQEIHPTILASYRDQRDKPGTMRAST